MHCFRLMTGRGFNIKWLAFLSGLESDKDKR